VEAIAFLRRGGRKKGKRIILLYLTLPKEWTREMKRIPVLFLTTSKSEAGEKKRKRKKAS